ncbi:hypothetical protein BGW38_002092 [Lunasporangiospora selenospora]|uniref:Amidohydrolase-related domain-containing protein n=1 Tax=Lunasporangiospora selenospora TaxID=979761 RepID=A0A9P6FSJ5_9FUNG|nr:hypothetical protein BGW38_002092 [Lunasporangiospora selenospora]
MDAVWGFYDSFYWPVNYKKTFTASKADFLIDQGLSHVVLLVYAHKNGIARELNRFLANMVQDMNQRYGRGQRRVASGLATVMPGEPDAVEILTEAFTTYNLAGIKMHSHVQCIAANDPSMDEVYETCVRFQKPCLIHAGKSPNSHGYKVDADKICDVSIIEDVLQRHPNLRLCVPHLGMHQYQEYFDLLDRYPNLYLDTTVALGAFMNSHEETKGLFRFLQTMFLQYSDRIFFGSDWPNIPYDWCYEIANLISIMDGDGEAIVVPSEMPKEMRGQQRTPTTDVVLERILWRNASRFYGISEKDLGLGQSSPAVPSQL